MRASASLCQQLSDLPFLSGGRARQIERLRQYELGNRVGLLPAESGASPLPPQTRWHDLSRRDPERFAQEAIGHDSKAVHRAYSRKAKVKLPSLENYEKQAAAGNVIPFQPALATGVEQQPARPQGQLA